MLKSPVLSLLCTMLKSFRPTGFSLLELLCCLSIIAVMVSYSISIYSGWLRKAQRTDAWRSLEYWATRLEQHNITARQQLLGGRLSLQGFYRIQLLSQANGEYILEANPVNQQARDTDCPIFRLESTGRHVAKPGC